MNMTINEYLFNPQGKGAIQPGLKHTKEDYDKRYEALLGLHNEFETAIYSSGKDVFYIYIKLPSESYEGITYDIVVKLKSTKGFENTVTDWNFAVVSNSPSFVFTYANVFRKNALLIDELKEVVERPAYTKAPRIRNPYFILGPEKNLYYAFKYIKDHFNDISTLKQLSSPVKLKELKEELTDISSVLTEIEIVEKKQSVQKKKEKEGAKKLAIRTRHEIMNNERSESINNNKLPNGQQSHTIQKIKPISSISRISRIKKR